MREISIDENVLRFAEKMIPLTAKMLSFTVIQQQVYTAFASYKGEAKKEIDTYGGKQIKQLRLLCDGYIVLSSNLAKIIQAFQTTDEASKQKIEAYHANIEALLQAENDRLPAVLTSQGR